MITINKQARKGIQTLALFGSLIALSSGCAIPNRAASDYVGGEIVRQSIGAAINPNSRETNVNVYGNSTKRITGHKWGAYIGSDGKFYPVPGCSWVNNNDLTDHRITCPDEIAYQLK